MVRYVLRGLRCALKIAFISPQRVMLPSAHPVGCKSLLKIKMAVWRTFFLLFNLLDFNVRLARFKFKKGAPNGYNNLQRAATTD
jgi:hypothetical protein